MPPAPPWFIARSFPLARFGVGCHIVPVDGLLRHPCTCPDLETFFHKMLFQHIFPGKCVPNRFWHTGGNSRTTVPEPTIPKTSEWERAAIKAGSRGLPLVFFPPTFFKESRAPLPESAGNPRCRVYPAMVPTESPIDDRGPGPLSPHFSGEMGTPAGQAGQRGAAPQGREEPRPPQGYAVPPTRDWKTTPPCGMMGSILL